MGGREGGGLKRVFRVGARGLLLDGLVVFGGGVEGGLFFFLF